MIVSKLVEVNQQIVIILLYFAIKRSQVWEIHDQNIVFLVICQKCVILNHQSVFPLAPLGDCLYPVVCARLVFDLFCHLLCYFS